jgi:hypothetical protein
MACAVETEDELLPPRELPPARDLEPAGSGEMAAADSDEAS